MEARKGPFVLIPFRPEGGIFVQELEGPGLLTPLSVFRSAPSEINLPYTQDSKPWESAQPGRRLLPETRGPGTQNRHIRCRLEEPFGQGGSSGASPHPSPASALSSPVPSLSPVLALPGAAGEGRGRSQERQETSEWKRSPLSSVQTPAF